MKVDTITFTMLNSIPNNDINPRIHIQVMNIGANVITVSSIRPKETKRAMKTRMAVNVTMKLKSAFTYSTNILASI